jgi:uroporphyrinogen-III synthase
MPFPGTRVLSLESRRAKEIATLIRNQGGDPFVAPSMREVPMERNEGAFLFAESLFANEYDMVVLLTGVGTRYLAQVIETRYESGVFIRALRRTTVAVRGPKPLAVMREWGVPVAVTAPEPNTWRELLGAIKSRGERRLALQEYGKPSPELVDGLRAQGREVTCVPVYQWELPENLDPLREAITRLAAGEFGVVMFTTATQVDHLMKIAGQMEAASGVREGLERAIVASIGPTTSEALRDHSIRIDVEPSHPKMGFLVSETAARFS